MKLYGGGAASWLVTVYVTELVLDGLLDAFSTVYDPAVLPAQICTS